MSPRRVVALAAFFVVSPFLYIATTQAASPKSPAKTVIRPIKLKELIDRAIKTGNDKVLGADMPGALGFGQSETHMKRLRLDADNSADHLEHAFNVVTEYPSVTSPKPIALLVSFAGGEMENGAIKSVDSYMFRADMKGRLLGAIRIWGPIKTTQLDKLPLNKSIRVKFKKEIDFHLLKTGFWALTISEKI